MGVNPSSYTGRSMWRSKGAIRRPRDRPATISTTAAMSASGSACFPSASLPVGLRIDGSWSRFDARYAYFDSSGDAYMHSHENIYGGDADLQFNLPRRPLAISSISSAAPAGTASNRWSISSRPDAAYLTIAVLRTQAGSRAPQDGAAPGTPASGARSRCPKARRSSWKLAISASRRMTATCSSCRFGWGYAFEPARETASDRMQRPAEVKTLNFAAHVRQCGKAQDQAESSTARNWRSLGGLLSTRSTCSGGSASPKVWPQPVSRTKGMPGAAVLTAVATA